MRLEGHRNRMLVWPAALVLAGSALLAAPSIASAHRSAKKRVGRCDAHLPKAATNQKGKVLVWQAEGTSSYSGEDVTMFYACLRPNGKSVAIGETEESNAEYVGNVETSDFRTSGTLVSDLVTAGAAAQEACGKYDGTGCGEEVSEVAQVFNLATGRSLRQPLTAAPIAYALTSLGAIAWEAPTSEGQAVLQAMSFDPSNMKSGSVETIDTGALGGSLHFTGLTLAWTNAGKAKSQRIAGAVLDPPAGG
jgi:hypothetical protein